MLKKALSIASVLALGFSYAYAVDSSIKTKAASAAAEIIEMRSGLAKSFIMPGAEVNEETFKKVCGAVGKRVKEINEKGEIKIRHAAVKYRNPVNAATAEEAALIEKFEMDKNLNEIEDTVEKDGKKFYHYTRPIYTEAACLACHGEKDSRPKFVVEKYPDDRAYGFRQGDLRGVISATAPVE